MSVITVCPKCNSESLLWEGETENRHCMIRCNVCGYIAEEYIVDPALELTPSGSIAVSIGGVTKLEPFPEMSDEEMDKFEQDINDARNIEKNLRCCSNCLHADIEFYCTKNKNFIYPKEVCEKWKWDNEKYEDRKI